MSSSLIKLGLLGALSIGGTWLFGTHYLNQPKNESIESEDKPIQEIIKEVYLRINTK